MTKRVEIWTDGSCLKNPGGPGGWAAKLIHGERVSLLQGRALATTNNLMELRAIVAGIEALKSTRYPIVIHSDSRYALRALFEWRETWARYDWRKSNGDPVLNRPLIERAHERLTAYRFKIEPRWVKGHSGLVHNEEVDRIAGEEARGAAEVLRQVTRGRVDLLADLPGEDEGERFDPANTRAYEANLRGAGVRRTGAAHRKAYETGETDFSLGGRLGGEE